MGYLQSILPKYFARLGHEVHVVTMPFAAYYRDPRHEEIFRRFNPDPALAPGNIETLNGYTLHVLDAHQVLGYMRMVRLQEKLRELAPEVVQVLVSIGWTPLDAARWSRSLNYRLFTGNHNSMSTSRQALGLDGSIARRGRAFLTRFIPGRLASFAAERCYAVTSDCAEIAWRYYGVQKHKVEVMHLGVDTDFFFPAQTAEDQKERTAVRAQLGFAPEEIVCVYSGKMTEVKNARILGQAVNRLREHGLPYSGLFIGDGPQRNEIEDMPHCRVLDFMHYSKLGRYYRAGDIGIWPTNESTSMLDAAACGIPIIISDMVVYREHVEGNGLVCRVNDVDSLTDAMLELSSLERRREMGERGSQKMLTDFSWESVARRRVAHYEQALLRWRGR